jgi:6-phosphogluconolactonase
MLSTVGCRFVEIVVVPNAEEVARSAAQWLARRIRSAVRLRGECRLALSGGSTPVPMFDVLATLRVPWESVTVFQVDERVAPDGHADRNATQLCDHLFRHVEIRQQSQMLMPVTGLPLERAAADYAAAVGQAQLDIVHLGLGDDGHTASWPPHDPVVDDPAEVAVTGVFNGRVRMTMTAQPVNRARARLVEVVGDAKAERVAEWLLGRPDLPIQAVRRGNTTLILDQAAACLVPPEALIAR